MEIQVSRPKMVTRFTLHINQENRRGVHKYLNTTADASTIFRYAKLQNEAHTARDTMGTPRLSVFARIAGADPPRARAYRVREQM